MRLKVLSLIISVLIAGFGSAQTAPTAINFQGRLTRLDGKPLPDGQYVVTIRLWRDLTSTNGSDLLITWQNLSVQVRSGVFSTALPNLTEAVLAGGVAYLEIEPAGQAPLTPRVPLLSVPYAVLAGTVFDGAIGTAKLKDSAVTATKVSPETETLQRISETRIFATPTGVGIGAPPIYDPFTVYKSGESRIYTANDTKFAFLSIDNSRAYLGASPGLRLDLGTTTTAVSIQANGFVGLGTSSPLDRLHLSGPDNVVGVRLEKSGATTTALHAGPDYGWVGTLSNHRMLIGAGNASHLALLQNGFLGIGTMSPDSNLDVAGSARIRDMLYAGSGANRRALRSGELNELQLNPFGDFPYVYCGSSIVVSSGLTVQTGGVTVQGGGILINSGGLVIKNTGLTINAGGLNIASGGIEAAGTCHRSNNKETWDTSSDRRLKTKIRPVTNALHDLLSLAGKTYEYRTEPGALRRGFIAQEVQRTFPDWVHIGDDGYLQLNKDGFDALAVEAFREQQQTIQKLNSKVQHLYSKLRSQDRTIELLMRRLDRLEGKP